MMKRRKWLKWSLLALALVGSAAGAVAYRVYTTDPGRLLAKGCAALAAGRTGEALRHAARLEQLGHGPAALLLRGEVWLAHGRAGGEEPLSADEALRRAVREFAEVRDDGPLAADAAVGAGECLLRLGDHKEAATVLGAVVRTHPDHREGHRWLAAVFLDLNSPTEAIEHLTEWGRLDPDEGRPFRWIGMFHKDYNHPEKAIPAYREALRRRLDPDLRADVVAELAEALLRTEADYQAALDVLAGCPEAFARRADVRTLRAECHWGLGQADAATALLDGLLRDDPENVPALTLRGRIDLNADDPAGARTLFERALRADPRDLGSRQHLIEACGQLHDQAAVGEHRRLLEESRGYRQRLTQLYLTAAARPWDDGVRVEIAAICLKMNRQREARVMLRAALACNPGNREARRRLEAMPQ
jgi:tetratricopeptide (TPR) repeat protein